MMLIARVWYRIIFVIIITYVRFFFLCFDFLLSSPSLTSILLEEKAFADNQVDGIVGETKETGPVLTLSLSLLIASR